MQRSTYVRPIGLFPAPADAREDAWSGLPLAGQALRFTAIEVSVRDGARVSRRVISLEDAIERDWGRKRCAAARSRGDACAARAPRRAGARPAAHHGHRQRHARQLLRRRPLRSTAGGHRARAAARRRRVPTSSTSAASRRGPAPSRCDAEEELRRVMPVIEALARRRPRRGSRSTPARPRSCAAPPTPARDIINDVSALTHDPRALRGRRRDGPAGGPDARAGRSAHHAGRPALRRRGARRVTTASKPASTPARRAGIPRARLVVDPGIGFGKTLAPQPGAARRARPLPRARLRRPARRLAQELHRPADRRARCGATACRARSPPPSLGAAQGVQILRVHDVAATRQALAVWRAALTARARRCAVTCPRSAAERSSAC